MCYGVMCVMMNGECVYMMMMVFVCDLFVVEECYELLMDY